MVDKMRPMNMIFHGPPGTGKTSAAQIFLRAWERFDRMEINGSLQTGVDFMREQVEGFARTPFGTADIRLCFIDEADHLSASAQASLRVLIEKSEHGCRFIFAVNELGKLSAPLKSRLQAVNFRIPAANRLAVQSQLKERLSERLIELGIKFDPVRLDDIVSLYFPDFRRIANALEFEFGA